MSMSIKTPFNVNLKLIYSLRLDLSAFFRTLDFKVSLNLLTLIASLILLVGSFSTSWLPNLFNFKLIYIMRKMHCYSIIKQIAVTLKQLFHEEADGSSRSR